MIEDAPPEPSAASPGTDPIWDDWETPLTAPAVPLLHLDGFDGPMDLLLDLAERQRIDLGRMSFLALVQQFVAELEGRLRAAAIERKADWLVVAARLLLLRSRLLFPANPAAALSAERDAARELARLEDKTFVRAAAAWLEARPQLGRDVFARPKGRNPRVASYMALMEACLTVLQGRAGHPEAAEPEVYRVAVLDLWRVQDALARVHALLTEHPEGGDMLAFLPPLPESPNREQQAKAAISSTLIAALELARGGEVRLEQASLFAPILVSAAAGSSAGEISATAA